MSIYVNDKDIASYQRDGAICLRNVFDPRSLAALRKGIEMNLSYPSPYAEYLIDNNNTVFFNDYCNWQNIPTFKEFILNSQAKYLVKALMGTRRVGFYHEHVLIKDPNNQKLTPWHHDQPYYPIEGDDLCSIWLPLDPVPITSSLKFVKGSHHWEGLFIPRKFKTHQNYPLKKGEKSVYDTVPDIDSSPEQYEFLTWALTPGDCIVFHGKTLHSTKGNIHPHLSRRVFSTRWVGDDARFCSRPWAISPPITDGLKPGARFESPCFPTLIRE